MRGLPSIILFILVFTGCNAPKNDNNAERESEENEKIIAASPVDDWLNLINATEIHDTSFVYLKNWSAGFSYDLKYATEDNFIKQKVYDCDQCLIRKIVAIALMKANHDLLQKGLHIKFFDCYRPLDVQKIMWEVYPVEGYVANPYTSGSNHNKGGAVDITLVDENGIELAMGTEFDYFGEEAHHNYKTLPENVLKNRTLLKSIMESHGFKSINTEWWHYNFKEARNYPLSNFKTQCPE